MDGPESATAASQAHHHNSFHSDKQGPVIDHHIQQYMTVMTVYFRLHAGRC